MSLTSKDSYKFKQTRRDTPATVTLPVEQHGSVSVLPLDVLERRLHLSLTRQDARVFGKYFRYLDNQWVKPREHAILKRRRWWSRPLLPGNALTDDRCATVALSIRLTGRALLLSGYLQQSTQTLPKKSRGSGVPTNPINQKVLRTPAWD